MKLERREGSAERRVLIGMVVDDAVLGTISSKWTKDGLFASRWSNLVGKWCCAHFENYQSAPKKAVESLFEEWATGNGDKDTIDLVERFLESLSGEYEQMAKESNGEYLLDLAATHFDRVAVERLKESLTADLEAKDVAKALKRVENFARPEVGKSHGVDVLTSVEALKNAFRKKADPLIVYPGALGTFFRDALERDALISFMGPEKRGKTFWLIDIAWRAMLQGRRVAFFEVGDMSEGQILLRFASRAAKRPIRATDPGKPVRYPVGLEHDPDAKQANVTFDEFDFPEALDWKEAWAAVEGVAKKLGDKKLDSRFRLSCHPNSTLTVHGITSILQSWDRQGWGTPDVIVIDYADVLSPTNGSADTRDQINATWKALRALSQSLHALVVTATQSDADSYTVETMNMGNFSEDKRKNAHVTGMVGINQAGDEKKLGLQRLNWLALRESEFTPSDVCHVAGCLAVANPAILSSF